jgi:putative restriction endonuclease
MSINDYLTRFEKIRPRSADGREKPHKICMLLAVLDLAKAGGLRENKIYFNADLIERYNNFFKAAAALNDVPNPHYPFFFLRGALKDRSASFWHLQAVAGREANLLKLNSISTLSELTSTVEYAWLDQELFELLKIARNIDTFEESITKYWFNRTHTDLRSIVNASSQISEYEKLLRQGGSSKLPINNLESVRSPAFRRVVTQIYDYRCAATGVRLLLPSGEAMVEAAHIHPFSEARDDDPRNGLALTPNIHWAMDKNLIAPGPDRLWHVSKLLDRRIPDFLTLTVLDGMPLLLPTELRFAPKEESLLWRINRLRG